MNSLPPRVLRKLEKLAAARIQILPLPAIGSYCVLEREGFAALVERLEDDFGHIGAAGLVTSEGLAVLVWEGHQPLFVNKKTTWPATEEQVSRLREFSAALEEALAER